MQSLEVEYCCQTQYQKPRNKVQVKQKNVWLVEGKGEICTKSEVCCRQAKLKTAVISSSPGADTIRDIGSKGFHGYHNTLEPNLTPKGRWNRVP